MQETIIEAESINAAAKGSSSVASGALGDFALKNAEAMQKWQDDFCAMAGVYAFCLNSTGEPFTTFSGNPSEIEIIRKYVTETRVREIFRRVSESDLEDQAVELTEVPNLKLAAVAVKDGQRTSAVWIVCGIFSDYDYDKEYFHLPPIDSFGYKTSEIKFYKTLDLLRETLNVLINLETSRSQAIAISE